jgi:hypothetical protein
MPSVGRVSLRESVLIPAPSSNGAGRLRPCRVRGRRAASHVAVYV